MNLDLRTILFIVLGGLIIFGFIKRLFKLVIFVAIVAALFYFYNMMM